ncbi:hypothetical protein [Bifidobacterium phasiani]|uniref:Lipoprotein n=1 Tax=Bifidobacterium phasiani TaxID=2834431 RepID=A0ABS6WBM3_9BIFI|nr:hypothetical protein [Bifidobacterium phasiani]MBW3083146.1 hypothetical protein [Bifidobacterium phasiani]
MVRIAAVLVAAWLLVWCVAACAPGSPGETPSGGAEGEAAQSVGDGQKIAGSMGEYIDQVLSWGDLTDKERTMLERARQDGALSVSDYEQAWSDFRACMTDRGYPPFELANYNGVYAMPPLDFTGTPDEWDRYKNDYDACYGQIDAIDVVYAMQVGNPGLYTDMYEAVADCLRREEAVPADYTADDLRRESGDDSGSGDDPYAYFDRQDPVFRGCKAANGWTSAYADDQRVDLWHGTGGASPGQ